MLKIVWLTSLCLAAIAGSIATQVMSVRGIEFVAAADRPAATDASRGTLTKADKFAVVYVVPPAADVPPPSAAAQPGPIKPESITAGISRDRPAGVAKRAKPRPELKLAKDGNGIDRSKAASDMKACRPQDAIASFLVSAGLSPRCVT